MSQYDSIGSVTCMFTIAKVVCSVCTIWCVKQLGASLGTH